jgi:hypothetical protein
MKMSFRLIALCALLMASAASQATTFTFSTDANANSTGGGVGASASGAPLLLTLGEVFSISTDAGQLWHGANPGDPNYGVLTTNADGSSSNAWLINLNGINTSLRAGDLVGSIDGVYRLIGAGTKNFEAWGTGELKLQYTDVNRGDNSGAIISNVTVDVPEPATYTMLLAGLGLLGFTLSRRKNS